MLIAPADSVAQAGQALAEGADQLDITGCEAAVAAAIKARYPGAALWPGPAGRDFGAPGPAALVDADLVAAVGATPAGPPPGSGAPAADAPVAAVITVAAISTWLGAAAVRTRHVQPVRRAIDMTSAIAGRRAPALTTRGLA